MGTEPIRPPIRRVAVRKSHYLYGSDSERLNVLCRRRGRDTLSYSYECPNPSPALLIQILILIFITHFWPSLNRNWLIKAIFIRPLTRDVTVRAYLDASDSDRLRSSRAVPAVGITVLETVGEVILSSQHRLSPGKQTLIKKKIAILFKSRIKTEALKQNVFET